MYMKNNLVNHLYISGFIMLQNYAIQYHLINFVIEKFMVKR